MDFLLLRFEAPMMSFGGPTVDANGVIQDFPSLSMMTGLIGNALGFEHRQFGRLTKLQRRIHYAVRRDRAGEKFQDYQTVDLGQDFMLEDRAWTTFGHCQSRGTNDAATGTHIRQRDYWCDAIYTISLGVIGSEEPSIASIESALNRPERPLFLGRKCCPPATPIMIGRCSADTAIEAVAQAPLPRGESGDTRHAWWEVDPSVPPERAMVRSVTDARDWVNQVHLGERWIAHGEIKISGAPESKDD
jgi:CRISPR system Cascade subunit CasD